ncbi:MAG: hypothetical protein HRU70_14670 [Phycisphaeraceae bacterium]|nr:MAG: hypothetical protein HRU70_14670 [Phycisphaeraceae bacterium]
MYEHIFQWRRERCMMVYSIENTVRGMQLVLDDVSARSHELVNAIPDWVVEREVREMAALHGAHYM